VEPSQREDSQPFYRRWPDVDVTHA
jgi:hypothetical protein